ncbi:MAG TPA: glycosyltransferase [Thermoanaerobaculia bacterium]|nr:glycosyltransferase [Thermoanaerobaculia bacterium]
MTSLRVLHLIPSLGGGGAERQITYLARGLAQSGVDVHVAFLREGSNFDRLAASGATLHCIASRGNYDALLVARIARLIRSVKPHLVQTWLTQMDVLGGAAATLTRTPWLLSERSSPPAYPRTFKHRLRERIGAFAAGVVANSPPGLEVWKHARGAKFVVPNAVAFDEIAAAARDESLVPPDAQVVLFAGRLDREKNIPTLVAALAQVTEARNAVAILCGEGPQENETRALIAGRERILLHGFTPRLWNLMKRADALVAVSIFEGNPNVVIEAAAAGLPAVLSDIPAHRAFLGDDAALCVPTADANAIAGAILRTLDDRPAALARAANARRAVERWSIEHAAAAYVRVYRQIVGQEGMRCAA